MTMAATLLFGLGATKAGTSWFYRFLAAHPQCHLRTIKELHFFDALESGNTGKQVARLQARLETLQAGPAGETSAKDQRRISDLRHWIKVLESGDQAAYLAYLAHGSGPDTRLIADITPAYALLPEGRLKRMARMAENVRFVYLMRDPVDRLWSHVRMIARRRMAQRGDFARQCDAILGRVCGGGEQHISARGDYRAVLSKFAKVLDGSSLFVGYYEELFEGGLTDRICSFLGLAPAPAPVAQRVHAGMQLEMTAPQRAAAAAYLQPQYDYVRHYAGRLPDAWNADNVGV